jgi:hypothetical protein
MSSYEINKHALPITITKSREFSSCCVNLIHRNWRIQNKPSFEFLNFAKATYTLVVIELVTELL